MNRRKPIKRKNKDAWKAEEEKTNLTDRQEMFCQIISCQEIRNIFGAYKKAGYSSRGNVGRVAASQLHAQPNIQNRIKQLRVERIERLKIKGDEVVRRLMQLSSANILDFCTFDSGKITLKSSEQVPRELAYCIQEIRQTPSGVSLKLSDKKPALQLLAQHFGLLDGSGIEKDPEQGAKDLKRYFDSLMGSVPPNDQEVSPIPQFRPKKTRKIVKRKVSEELDT